MFRFILSTVTAAGLAPVCVSAATASEFDLSSLVIDDPSVLEQLDGSDTGPLALRSLLKAAERATAANNDAYDTMATQVTYDVEEAIKGLAIDWEKDIRKTYLPSAAKTSDGRRFRKNGNVMRVFDANWLRSPKARFVLAGIVNRMDRQTFVDASLDAKQQKASIQSCGETRLIYRLGYVVREKGRTYASRMPFTVNLVYDISPDKGGCSSRAKAWMSWHKGASDPAKKVKAVLNGPFNPANLTFKQMEINAQIGRFPSDLEKDEKRYFAGQALYLMRIFAERGGSFKTITLENTPDVTRLRKNAKDRQELAKLLSSNLEQIDNGAFVIPGKYLTDIALTWSTQGSARTGNRPWDHVFTEAERMEIFSGGTKSGFKAENAKFIASPAALSERLNMATCMGCHQTASTAGFHFLGRDRMRFGKIRGSENITAGDIKKATDGNRLALPYSPHFYGDAPRRTAWLKAAANEDTPEAFIWHPARPLHAKKEALCIPAQDKGSELGSRAIWSCEKGLTCTGLAENKRASFHTGICTGPVASAGAGYACRTYKLNDSLDPDQSGTLAWNLQAFRNTVISDKKIYDLPEGKLTAEKLNCRPTAIGVPNGRISRNCSQSEKLLKGISATSIESGETHLCAVVGGKGFEEMAKGLFDSEAFGNGVSRGMLNACHATLHCREDYICQALPDFLAGRKFGVASSALKSLQSRGIGFCTPTYFVYQLRLDGHPIP